MDYIHTVARECSVEYLNLDIMVISTKGLFKQKTFTIERLHLTSHLVLLPALTWQKVGVTIEFAMHLPCGSEISTADL